MHNPLTTEPRGQARSVEPILERGGTRLRTVSGFASPSGGDAQAWKAHPLDHPLGHPWVGQAVSFPVGLPKLERTKLCLVVAFQARQLPLGGAQLSQ